MAVDRIRLHVECMKREVATLVEKAGDDECIGNGLEAFAIDMVQRLVNDLETTLDKLPHRKTRDERDVSVEIEDECGRRLPLEDGPKRARRSDSKKRVPADCN
jgi:hypothetical protein